MPIVRYAPAEPPTSAGPASPGVMVMSVANPCVPVGSVPSSSSEITVWRRVFWTSTSGLAPVTVTVSSSAPTRISTFTVAVKPLVNSMPSRLTVLNPASAKVTT